MVTASKGAPANDDALSIGDLLNASDRINSRDPEEFDAAVAVLSTAPGEKMLETIAGIAARLAEAETEAEPEPEIERWRSDVGGATICSSGTRRLHSSNRVGLTTLGECYPLGEGRDGRRPTFKVLRWHAAAGDNFELMPAAALREAFLVTLTGNVSVHVDGAAPRRLAGTQSAGAMWLGGVEQRPWLPRVRLAVVGTGGAASGLLILLSEAGVPLLDEHPTDSPFRHTQDDLPVRLAPSRQRRDAGSFWQGLARRGIDAPVLFHLPRGPGALRWCRALPDVVEDPRAHFPHDAAVKDGLLLPKELPAWQDLRGKVVTEDWPTLMFRVLELPPLAKGMLAQLERHDGAEALLAWIGAFTFLTRKRGSSPRQRLDVPLDCSEPALECRRVRVHADGSFDVLILDSDHFHTIVAEERAAVALHFTGSQVGWSSRWRQLADKEALAIAAPRKDTGDVRL